jgi:hypothetical protein
MSIVEKIMGKGKLAQDVSPWVLYVEGLFWKKPIQCQVSSEILTPHPLTARRVFIPHRLWCGGRTHSLAGEGVGGQ